MGCSAVLTCSTIQAALSARLDGETPGIDDDVIDTHLDSCPDCQAYFDQAVALNRSLAFRIPEAAYTEAPDLIDDILANVEPQWRKQAATRAWNTALSRVSIVVAGLLWLAWAINLIAITSTEIDPLANRVSMEAASLRFAIAFSLFFAAWQPRVVGGLLPVVAAVWTFEVGFGIRDIFLAPEAGDIMIQLGLLFLAVVTLSWLWISDKGWVIVREMVRSLSSDPR